MAAPSFGLVTVILLEGARGTFSALSLEAVMTDAFFPEDGGAGGTFSAFDLEAEAEAFLD